MAVGLAVVGAAGLDGVPGGAGAVAGDDCGEDGGWFGDAGDDCGADRAVPGTAAGDTGSEPTLTVGPGAPAACIGGVVTDLEVVGIAGRPGPAGSDAGESTGGADPFMIT